MNYIENRIQRELNILNETGGLRCIPNIGHDGKYISTLIDNVQTNMINLSSNDYLGLATDCNIQDKFMESFDKDLFSFSSSSSRLLTGNFSIYDATESLIAKTFGKEAALIFGSGYQMNTGILPTITDKNTLILADKLVHASIIDGIKLSNAECIRYKHQDYEQIENIVKKYYNKTNAIVIVTESIFSMDGDVTNLQRLVKIKKSYPSVMLYVDEAHAIGVRGHKGLGIAEEQNCTDDIDFLCGTLGKALASVGAYIVCSKSIREYLINKMRSFIFTTALPPINIAWTKFVFSNLEEWNDKRERLTLLSEKIVNKIRSKNIECISGSHIIPIMSGSNEKAISLSDIMQREGFYVLPIRHPTVPIGKERLRISLNASITDNEIEKLSSTIESII